MPVYTIISLHYAIAYLTSYNSIYMRFYPWIDNSSDSDLAKKKFCLSLNRLPFRICWQPCCIIEFISSDADSREELDDGKQTFVGQAMAEL